MMAVEKIEVRTCDRCNARHEVITESKRNEWGLIYAHALGAERREDLKLQVIGSLGKPGISADICPPCLDDLMAWWGQRGRHVLVYPDRERDR